MSKLKTATMDIFDQLDDLLQQIRDPDYARQIDALGASVGQHIRHIIEFYQCLFDGLSSGVVNYDLRKRDHQIENERSMAVARLAAMRKAVEQQTSNPALTLQVKYGDPGNEHIQVETCFHRELIYNIEHAVHHMAIIRSSLRELYAYIELSGHFGIASSTQRYRSAR